MIRSPKLSTVLVVLVAATLGFAAPEEKPTLVLEAGGHTARVWKIVFTPDGKEVITVSDDKTIRFWDAATGEPLRVLRPPLGRGNEGRLYALALSPDGRRLAVGGYGAKTSGDIFLIDTASTTVELVLKGHENVIIALAFSRDGRKLVSGSGDNTARIWDVRTGKCVQTLRGPENSVYGVAFSPDGRRVLTGSFDKTARIWSAEDGTCMAVLREHSAEVHPVAWNPEGDILATGGYDRTVSLWQPDGKLLRTVKDLPGHVVCLDFHPTEAKLLATTGDNGKDECWIIDTTTGKQLGRFQQHTSTVFAGRFSPDGKRIASTGGDNSESLIWSVDDGSVLATLVGKGKTFFAAAWSPDGKAIAWGSKAEDGTLNAARSLERTFLPGDLAFGPAPEANYRRAQVKRGNLALAAGRTLRELEVRQGDRGPVLLKLEGEYEGVRCFTLLPANRAVIGGNFRLYLYDSSTGHKVREFLGYTGPIWAVAPSPDGRYFLSASYDQTLRIWDPNRDEPLLSLFVAGDEWVAWTPEGYYACSAGGERLFGWHVNQGNDKLARFYAAAQFRATYHRPDVIKLLLRTGSVERAIEEANKVRNQKTEKVEVAKVLPPSVIIISPASLARITEEQVEVQAVARSVGDHPVTALRLLGNNGQRLGKVYEIGRPRLGEQRVKWIIDLPPGEHRLQVLADSAVSQGESDPIIVTRPSKEQSLPRLIILAIGAGTSADANVRALPRAGADALALQKAFEQHSKDKKLFREVVVRTVVDDKATRREMLKGLRWFSEEMTVQDVGVVFFAGHGKRDKTGQLYLLGHDTDPKELVETGVPGAQLRSTLTATYGLKLLFLDACYAGAINEVERSDTKSINEELASELGQIQNGLVVLCASRGNEEAKEDVRRGGYFTQALVEGLSGKKPIHLVEGVVYLSHLQAYVSDRVKQLSKNGQTPTFNVPPGITRVRLSKP